MTTDRDRARANELKVLLERTILPILDRYPEGATDLIAGIAAHMVHQGAAARAAGQRDGVDALGMLVRPQDWRRRHVHEIARAAAILFPRGSAGHAPIHVDCWRIFLARVRAEHPKAQGWIERYVPDGARWYAAVVQPALDAGEDDR